MLTAQGATAGGFREAGQFTGGAEPCQPAGRFHPGPGRGRAAQSCRLPARPAEGPGLSAGETGWWVMGGWTREALLFINFTQVSM